METELKRSEGSKGKRSSSQSVRDQGPLHGGGGLQASLKDGQVGVDRDGREKSRGRKGLVRWR